MAHLNSRVIVEIGVGFVVAVTNIEAMVVEAMHVNEVIFRAVGGVQHVISLKIIRQLARAVCNRSAGHDTCVVRSGLRDRW